MKKRGGCRRVQFKITTSVGGLAAVRFFVGNFTKRSTQTKISLLQARLWGGKVHFSGEGRGPLNKRGERPETWGKETLGEN